MSTFANSLASKVACRHTIRMSNRSLYFLGAAVGGTIGGFLPGLWHGSDFGGWAVLLSTIGGLLGIWAVYKFIV
jgi:hypothetical protein